jgi:hypothetical protein
MSEPVIRMFAALRQIAWRAEQLDVASVVRAAKDDWDDVVDGVRAGDIDAAEWVGAAPSLRLSDRQDVGVGVLPGGTGPRRQAPQMHPASRQQRSALRIATYPNRRRRPYAERPAKDGPSRRTPR